MQLDDNSSRGSSSSDEDIDLLFLENEFFPRTPIVGPSSEFEDLNDNGCEQMPTLFFVLSYRPANLFRYNWQKCRIVTLNTRPN